MFMLVAPAEGKAVHLLLVIAWQKVGLQPLARRRSPITPPVMGQWVWHGRDAWSTGWGEINLQNELYTTSERGYFRRCSCRE